SQSNDWFVSADEFFFSTLLYRVPFSPYLDSKLGKSCKFEVDRSKLTNICLSTTRRTKPVLMRTCKRLTSRGG
ncbi:hypothetical protein M8J75_001484, partial [Diaphorina citri]